jgi:hypothetical protein
MMAMTSVVANMAAMTAMVTTMMATVSAMATVASSASASTTGGGVDGNKHRGSDHASRRDGNDSLEHRSLLRMSSGSTSRRAGVGGRTSVTVKS